MTMSCLSIHFAALSFQVIYSWNAVTHSYPESTALKPYSNPSAWWFISKAIFYPSKAYWYWVRAWFIGSHRIEWFTWASVTNTIWTCLWLRWICECVGIGLKKTRVFLLIRWGACFMRIVTCWIVRVICVWDWVGGAFSLVILFI